jgi:5-(carboxyamino)imidazole ribonucleotide synthase
MNDQKKIRVGVLGAGQLALMLAQAGERIGVEVACAGQPGDCAGQAATVVKVDLNDAKAVAAFAEQVDVVTVESENLELDVLHGLNLHPNARAVGVAQDRLMEKRFFQECGVAVAPFAPVNSLEDLERAVALIGLPAILKTRRLGYDGKGQARIYTLEDAVTAWEHVGGVPSGVPCILEKMLAFDTEVSMIAARSLTGKIAFYPLVENFHRDGILRTSLAPYANATKRLDTLAESCLRDVLTRLEYVGVLAVEFFVVGEDLIANEMAPRVHNSGHWSIEGAETSQFENHLRAVAGMELGGTKSTPTVMLNCIGTMPPEAETAKFPGLLRHDYGKEAREGRKVGHLTFPATETEAIAEWQRRLQDGRESGGDGRDRL